MSTQTQPFTLQPGAGKRVPTLIGGPITFKLTGETSGGSMIMFESRPPAGQGPPLHLHQDQDEWLYVLDGEMRFRVDDDVVPAPPGSFVFIPRGVPHCWQNVDSRQGLLICVIAPAGVERFFERFAALPETERNPESFRALGPEEGMIVLGPPLAQSHPIPEPANA
jgi:quercetin dioxygenase-like cupin family protein